MLRRMTDLAGLLDEDARSALRAWPGGTWYPPALATLTHHEFSAENWIYERKLDGVRVIAGADGGGPELWSRNRKRVDASYPEIVDALAAQGAPSFVLDGEVVAFEGNKTSFARLQKRMHLTSAATARRTGVAIYYYAFALIAFRSIAGLASGVNQVAERLYVVQAVDRARLAFANGILSAAGSAGSVFGPFHFVGYT